MNWFRMTFGQVADDLRGVDPLQERLQDAERHAPERVGRLVGVDAAVQVGLGKGAHAPAVVYVDEVRSLHAVADRKRNLAARAHAQRRGSAPGGIRRGGGGRRRGAGDRRHHRQQHPRGGGARHRRRRAGRGRAADHPGALPVPSG